MRKKKQARYDEWEKTMLHYEQSGLSQEQFCKEQQLSFRQFKYYRYHLAKQNIKKTGLKEDNQLTPIEIVSTPKQVRENAVGLVQIIFPSCIKLVVPSTLPAAQLTSLIQEVIQCG